MKRRDIIGQLSLLALTASAIPPAVVSSVRLAGKLEVAIWWDSITTKRVALLGDGEARTFEIERSARWHLMVEPKGSADEVKRMLRTNDAAMMLFDRPTDGDFQSLFAENRTTRVFLTVPGPLDWALAPGKDFEVIDYRAELLEDGETRTDDISFGRIIIDGKTILPLSAKTPEK